MRLARRSAGRDTFPVTGSGNIAAKTVYCQFPWSSRPNIIKSGPSFEAQGGLGTHVPRRSGEAPVTTRTTLGVDDRLDADQSFLAHSDPLTCFHTLIIHKKPYQLQAPDRHFPHYEEQPRSSYPQGALHHRPLHRRGLAAPRPPRCHFARGMNRPERSLFGKGLEPHRGVPSCSLG